MPTLTLSAVGTSLLTNLSQNKKDRGELVRYANHQAEEIPLEIKNRIEGYERKIRELFKENESNSLKKASAELNSLLTFYKGGFEGHQRDVHVLISTDTFLGKRTAHLIKTYLDHYFQTVFVVTPAHLSTRSKQAFQSGIKDLLKWCDKNLEEYKNSDYEIVFNLTGGFKSLQGYLNTIGMFYANKIIYIFERADELITIPRLPIKIETQLFEEYAALFLQISQANEGVEINRLKDLPQMMLEDFGRQRYSLSDWGELSWNKTKQDILTQELIALPFLEYAPSFERDFQGTKNPKEKIKLQETIGFVSCQLQENKGDVACLKAGRSGGINYADYTGKNAHLGHFKIDRGRRVSCEFKNKKLVLRHYGEHDEVNENP